METLAQLGRRIRATEELETVTRMMKGLAAVGLRRCEEGVRTIDEYERIVEAGLQVALGGRRGRRVLSQGVWTRAGGDGADGSDSDRSLGLVVFGSDLGLCGSLNRGVATAVRESVDPDRLGPVVAVGQRLADELSLVGVGPVDTVIELPSTVEGISARVDDVVLWIDEHIGGRIDRVELVVPDPPDRRRGDDRWSAEGGPTVSRRVVVPADPARLVEIAGRPWPTSHLPMHRAPWPQLVAAMVRELLVVGLHRAFAQTMVAVDASRLEAMDLAQRSIVERLDELGARHRRLRQAEITDELLDVVAGFETLTSRCRP